MEEEIEKLKIEISEKIEKLKSTIKLLEKEIENEGDEIQETSINMNDTEARIAELEEQLKQLKSSKEISRANRMGIIRKFFYTKFSNKYKKTKEKINKINGDITDIQIDERSAKDKENECSSAIDRISEQEEEIINEIRRLQKMLAGLDDDDKKMKVLRAMKPELFGEKRSNNITPEEPGEER